MADQIPKSRPSRAIQDRGPCSRRPMRVEISKNIRWKRVVFPKSFEAFRCGGDCKFPLDKKVSSLHSSKVCLQGGRFTLANGVNPNWEAKDSQGLQEKFHRYGTPITQDNLIHGYTQRVWKQVES